MRDMEMYEQLCHVHIHERRIHETINAGTGVGTDNVGGGLGNDAIRGDGGPIGFDANQFKDWQKQPGHEGRIPVFHKNGSVTVGGLYDEVYRGELRFVNTGGLRDLNDSRWTDHAAAWPAAGRGVELVGTCGCKR